MKTLPFLFVILLVLLSACSSAAPSAGGIEISNATLVLPVSDSMSGMDMGPTPTSDAMNGMQGMDMSSEPAGYMQITNNSTVDDRLISASCDFADLELHETTMNGDVASMNTVSSIDIPAGSTVEFKSGGLHIMFTNMKKELKIGDTVALTLQFEKAGAITVSATVTGR
jgi:copper(I)-binding protein